jgi:hypothetical protein
MMRKFFKVLFFPIVYPLLWIGCRIACVVCWGLVDPKDLMRDQLKDYWSEDDRQS